jgi:hypothetical protein
VPVTVMAHARFYSNRARLGNSAGETANRLHSETLRASDSTETMCMRRHCG